jgi:hypothetical protein
MIFRCQHGMTLVDGASCLFAELVRSLTHSNRWQTSAGQLRLTKIRHDDHRAVFLAEGQWSGRLTLFVEHNNWVCAELCKSDTLVQRAWIEQPYEEFELWPDGADGVVGNAVDDDPPGRIGKRINWLQIDVRRWPGLQTDGNWLLFEAE